MVVLNVGVVKFFSEISCNVIEKCGGRVTTIGVVEGRVIVFRKL